MRQTKKEQKRTKDRKQCNFKKKEKKKRKQIENNTLQAKEIHSVLWYLQKDPPNTSLTDFFSRHLYVLGPKTQ